MYFLLGDLFPPIDRDLFLLFLLGDLFLLFLLGYLGDFFLFGDHFFLRYLFLLGDLFLMRVTDQLRLMCGCKTLYHLPMQVLSRKVFAQPKHYKNNLV